MGVKRSVSIAGVLLSVVMFGVWSVRAAGQAAPAKQASPPAAAATRIGPLKQPKTPPLPFGARDPLPRPNQVVAAVFMFAAEHPEILDYVPCFCGCEHMGHKGNTECFVKSRAPNGDVLAWEPHGTECQVCIDVGQQAMQMYSSGASVRDIRAAVEKRFATQYKNHTPTPPPPPAPARK
jgi:hypothetical protein